MFSIPYGWLADRASSCRLPYVLGLPLLFAAVILFAFSASTLTLVGVALLQGISAAVVRSVGYTMARESTGGKDIGKALGTVRNLQHRASLA